MRRATLRLGLACDNRCVFCAQRGLDGPVADGDWRARLAALAGAASELTLVGGEPLLAPELDAIVAAARAAGYSRVGLQTNSRTLASRAAALARAGLTDVHLSLHGASPSVHDYHAGVPGAFAALQSGWAAATAAGLDVVVTTVLTRSNFRVLGELPAWLARRGARAWTIAVPAVAGDAARSFDRVVPRLALALPFALHALTAARALGLEAHTAGAPLCLVGPHAIHALELGGDTPPVEEARLTGTPCDACAARSRCAGIDPAYRARFGAGELAARDPVAAAPSRWAHLFVGAGEPARVPPAAAVEKPRSLPLYREVGKVQPAHGEVDRTAPRRSGEALRTILPGLFEEPE